LDPPNRHSAALRKAHLVNPSLQLLTPSAKINHRTLRIREQSPSRHADETRPSLSKGEADRPRDNPTAGAKGFPQTEPRAACGARDAHGRTKEHHRAPGPGQPRLRNSRQRGCITPALCFHQLLAARLQQQQPRGRVVSTLPCTHPREKERGWRVKDLVSFGLPHTEQRGVWSLRSPARSLSSLASTTNPAASQPPSRECINGSLLPYYSPTSM